MFKEGYVRIKWDEGGGKKDKRMVLKEGVELSKKIFWFGWVDGKIEKRIERRGGMMRRIEKIKGSKEVMVNIKGWGIGLLIY